LENTIKEQLFLRWITIRYYLWSQIQIQQYRIPQYNHEQVSIVETSQVNHRE